MVTIFTYLFWLIVIAASFVFYKYRNSRNKHLFFKTGSYRSLIWTFSILVLAPVIINLLFPEVNLKLSTTNIIQVDDIKQAALLREWNLFKYYKNIVAQVWHNANFMGFVSALLILVTWFIYISKVDIFHKEKLGYLLLTVFLGMGFSFLTLLVSDVIDLYYKLTYTGNLFNDLFLYYFLGVGVIEELVKMIPFLIIWKLTKEINEPYDYILYASMSALGFAFIENLIYFREISSSIIQGRALLSVIGHILFSSFCVYGIVLAKYRHKKSIFKYFAITFLIGSFFHGLYDYLLTVSLIILVIPIFIFSIQAWTVIVNNAINNSDFFDFKITFREEKLRFFLAIMLTSILVLNYAGNALQFGKDMANANYFVSCLFGGLMVIFYITNLSNYDLVKGYWRPIAFRTEANETNSLRNSRYAGTLFSIFKSNFIQPINIVHYKIELHPPNYNHELIEIMDYTKGRVINRLCLHNISKKNGKEIIDTEWFLVALEETLNIKGHLGSHILIKLENKSSSVIHDSNLRAFMRIIPDFSLTRIPKPMVYDFPFVGYVLFNSIGVPSFK